MNRCISCQASSIRLVGKMPVSNNFAGITLSTPLKLVNLYECKDCCLWFRYPSLSGKERDILYTQVAEDKWSKYDAEREDWKIASNWIHELPLKSKVLDVGCFDGQFLKYLGSGYDRFGVEINNKASQHAIEKGINIISNNFADLQTLSDKFDVVMAMDVIEHAKDPLIFLGYLANKVCSGGRIIISTGNTNAWPWRFMKSKYYYCNIGEHISFINPQWLDKAAKHYGLKISQVVRFSYYKSGYLRRINDLCKNLLYIISPNTIACLRQKGFGKNDVQGCLEQTYTPPMWISAKDHLICLLEKP